LPKKFLKLCKRFKITPDEFLLSILTWARDEKMKAELFKYIYLRERAQNPTNPDSQTQKGICDKFGVSKKTLEKYIYWKDD